MPKILVVDDEKHIRDSCVKLLQRKRYDADGAASGVEALEKIGETVYDLVLLDVKMPGMDGIEVLRRAKEIVPDILVLILTGHGTMDTANEAMKLGAVGFIRKPISIEDLAESIDQALNRSKKDINTNLDLENFGE
jgi:DNA-binding NtrC family response regulator